MIDGAVVRCGYWGSKLKRYTFLRHYREKQRASNPTRNTAVRWSCGLKRGELQRSICIYRRFHSTCCTWGWETPKHYANWPAVFCWSAFGALWKAGTPVQNLSSSAKGIYSRPSNLGSIFQRTNRENMPSDKKTDKGQIAINLIKRTETGWTHW